MIKANDYQPHVVKQAYNRRGWIYSKTVALMEWEYHAGDAGHSGGVQTRAPARGTDDLTEYEQAKQ